jgi:low temperature requirement protein LtrA
LAGDGTGTESTTARPTEAARTPERGDDRTVSRPSAAGVRGLLWLRMNGRDKTQDHRVSTPLELFFDLCFVVAVGQAGSQLAHAVEQGRVAHGLLGFAVVFYAVWWAWMGFTWFASAYDTDDAPYRVATFVQIAGALVIAAGVPRAFANGDFTVVVVGYVIMRVAILSQWARVIRDDPDHRPAAVRWAGGVAVLQIGWVLVLPAHGWVHALVFGLLVVAEFLVPAWSARAGEISWHPHHIAERYGLFTLIVLGESVAAATVAVQSALDAETGAADLLPIALGGLLIVFSAWWIYFAAPAGEYLADGGRAIPWGYGHYLIFASAAAIGAGLEVAVARVVDAAGAAGAAEISVRTADAAVTVPTATFLFTVWLLHSRHSKRGIARFYLPAASVLVLACTFTGRAGVLCTGLVAALTVLTGTLTAAYQSE